MRSDDARALMNAQISEEQWQNQILELAARTGWLAFHIPDRMFKLVQKASKDNGLRAGHFLPQPGFPDTVLIRPPRLVFVELKSENGHLSSEQRQWIEALTACSVEVYVWKPRDWDEARETLER